MDARIFYKSEGPIAVELLADRGDANNKWLRIKIQIHPLDPDEQGGPWMIIHHMVWPRRKALRLMRLALCCGMCLDRILNGHKWHPCYTDRLPGKDRAGTESTHRRVHEMLG